MYISLIGQYPDCVVNSLAVAFSAVQCENCEKMNRLVKISGEIIKLTRKNVYIFRAEKEIA